MLSYHAFQETINIFFFFYLSGKIIISYEALKVYPSHSGIDISSSRMYFVIKSSQTLRRTLRNRTKNTSIDKSVVSWRRFDSSK